MGNECKHEIRVAFIGKEDFVKVWYCVNCGFNLKLLRGGIKK